MKPYADFKHDNIHKSLQRSWVERLYDDSIHDSKVVPLKHIDTP